MEKFAYFEKHPKFQGIDEDTEYDRRLLYMFTEETDNQLFKGILYIPIKEGELYDWEFFTYDKFDDMAILKHSARTILETTEWFHEVAKPIDHLTRLRKITNA